MYKDLGVPSARAVHIYKYTTKSETLNSANLINVLLTRRLLFLSLFLSLNKPIVTPFVRVYVRNN